MQQMPQDGVAELLGSHAGTDPKFANLLMRAWIGSLEAAPNTSFEKEAAAFLVQFLLLPMRCEVITMRGTGAVDAGAICGDWYLFGTEHPRFKVPFETLRVNFVMHCCLARLMYQGYTLQGRPAFARTETSAQRSEIKYAEFQLAETFSASFSRIALVAQFVLQLCARALLQQHTAAAAAAADGSSGADAVALVRVLVHATLLRVENDLRSIPRLPHWLGAEPLAQLHKLSELCSKPETFNPSRLLAAAIALSTPPAAPLK